MTFTSTSQHFIFPSSTSLTPIASVCTFAVQLLKSKSPDGWGLDAGSVLLFYNSSEGVSITILDRSDIAVDSDGENNLDGQTQTEDKCLHYVHPLSVGAHIHYDAPFCTITNLRPYELIAFALHSKNLYRDIDNFPDELVPVKANELSAAAVIKQLRSSQNPQECTCPSDLHEELNNNPIYFLFSKGCWVQSHATTLCSTNDVMYTRSPVADIIDFLVPECDHHFPITGVLTGKYRSWMFIAGSRFLKQYEHLEHVMDNTAFNDQTTVVESVDLASGGVYGMTGMAPYTIGTEKNDRRNNRGIKNADRGNAVVVHYIDQARLLCLVDYDVRAGCRRMSIHTGPDWTSLASVKHLNQWLARFRVHCRLSVVDAWRDNVESETAKARSEAGYRARSGFAYDYGHCMQVGPHSVIGMPEVRQPEMSTGHNNGSDSQLSQSDEDVFQTAEESFQSDMELTQSDEEDYGQMEPDEDSDDVDEDNCVLFLSD